MDISLNTILNSNRAESNFLFIKKLPDNINVLIPKKNDSNIKIEDKTITYIKKLPSARTFNKEQASEILSHPRNQCPFQPNEWNLTFCAAKIIIPDLQLNDGILWCDAEHYAIYRPLLAKFLILKVSEYQEKIRILASDYLNLATCSVHSDVHQFVERSLRVSLFNGNNDSPTLFSDHLKKFNPENASNIEMLNLGIDSIYADGVGTTLGSESEFVSEMLKNNFSINQIKAMIITLFSANSINIVPVITKALDYLINNSEFIDNFRQMHAKNPEEAATTLKKLIIECLRLTSPTPEIRRELTAGPCQPQHVTVNLRALTRNQNLVGENPDEFNLNRFANNIPNHLPSLNWMPFGGKKHGCVGWKYSYTVMSIFLTEFMLKPDLLPTSRLNTAVLS